MGRRSHETVCRFLSAVVIGASITSSPLPCARWLVEIKVGTNKIGSDDMDLSKAKETVKNIIRNTEAPFNVKDIFSKALLEGIRIRTIVLDTIDEMCSDGSIELYEVKDGLEYFVKCKK